MDLRSLHIFIEVAELKSFTRAGERLGYSQPTVSFQIKQLERELGVQLFDRIGHTVALTDEGRDALKYAQHIWHLSQEMAMGVGRRLEPGGQVRIGMPDSLCTPLVTNAFGSFREKYPRVQLGVITADTNDLLRLIDHNEVDLVCTMDTHVYDTSYIIASEEKIPLHFVASADNPLTRLETVELDILVRQSFLLTEKGMSYRRVLDEQLARRKLEIIPVLEMGGADQLCQLVEQDMGLSFLPDYVTEEAVRAGRIRRLNVPDFEEFVWMQLLYRRDKWISLQMQALIDHISAIRLIKEEVI